ncbi:hypothetical protein PG993_013344 [Apiospora rasikravindrae]|uniref:Cyanovirin-N domain-containing protein n=1 Tax=Apiospora rasikravindrae TaxID=990691 RepID=A0ABR1RXC9_9PEZI
MAKLSLLGIFLCALMAMLASANEEIWSTSCYEGAAVVEHKLTAYCKTAIPMGPPWVCSQMNLNLCYAFSADRGIYGQEDGYYGDVCSACRLQLDGHTMECYCRIGEGPGVEKYTVDTDFDITVNANGKLRCFQHTAANCPDYEDAAFSNVTNDSHIRDTGMSLPLAS